MFERAQERGSVIRLKDLSLIPKGFQGFSEIHDSPGRAIAAIIHRVLNIPCTIFLHSLI